MDSVEYQEEEQDRSSSIEEETVKGQDATRAAGSREEVKERGAARIAEQLDEQQ